jgi:hypothetical protein
MEPFRGKIVGFRNVEWANHIKFDTFTETLNKLKNHSDWKLLKNQNDLLSLSTC